MSTSDIPPLTPELAALSILLETYLRASKPQARARFLSALDEVLAERECSVPLIRPASQASHVLTTRRKGARWLKRLVEAMGARPI